LCTVHIEEELASAHLATKTRRAEKRRKYLAAARAKGDEFKPLVFETHGKMADEIKDVLNMLASNTTWDRGLAVSDMQLDLAVTLARGNALAARDTIAKAEKERDNRRAIFPRLGNDNNGKKRYVRKKDENGQ
jgi:hypothetical protein